MTTTESKKLCDKIVKGVRKGVAQALRDHKKAGIPIAVWQDGRVIRIPPSKIRVPKV